MLNRRQFAAAGLATIAFAGLARWANTRQPYHDEIWGYGALVPDPQGLFDLPPGFTYRVISAAGEKMADGFSVPDNFDGMGCFPLDRDRVLLVRNHELEPDERALGPTAENAALDARLREAGFFGSDLQGNPLPGGTTTMLYNMRTGRTERQHLSLAGTASNCAGGATPWGSWLSCEETDLLAGKDALRSHGWIFEVPAAASGLVAPIPLEAMGRFRHEAAVVDRRTGILYLTEDREDGLFYRFLPNQPGRLAAGGRLQALGLRTAPRGGDTRNWGSSSMDVRKTHETFWVDLDGTNSAADDLRQRGHAKGAALFARGEGIHSGSTDHYFTCTSGGAAKIGQIMRYTPSRAEGQKGEKDAPGRLEIFLESDDASVLNYIDNLVVTPWAHLIACEDRDEKGDINHLKGITSDGAVYTIARLNAPTELAGACFSPDRSTLFVNVYAPGRTLAITGPWDRIRTA